MNAERTWNERGTSTETKYVEILHMVSYGMAWYAMFEPNDLVIPSPGVILAGNKSGGLSHQLLYPAVSPDHI